MVLLFNLSECLERFCLLLRWEIVTSQTSAEGVQSFQRLDRVLVLITIVLSLVLVRHLDFAFAL